MSILYSILLYTISLDTMKLTKNFTYEEMVASATATAKHIDNTPTKEQTENMRILCEKVLQPIRDKWSDSIIVNSCFRCEKLNKAVGGAKTSLHMDGLAADIRAKDLSKNIELWKLIDCMIKSGEIEVRSLIWEYGTKKNPRWIHIDINGAGHTYRRNKYIYYYD